jgi:3-hydroxyacyl-CoA dehydrogenase/3a,7a,12a-trihydroxy-5b-cholest-24-enoyl-CoA hydratase
VLEEKTSEAQALLYRLSGDWNPLHADPASRALRVREAHPARAVHVRVRGTPRAQGVRGGDARRFKSIKVRFADSVFPGETLVTEMWKESETRVVFRCKVKERDKVVISNAAVELYTEVPKKKAKASAPAARRARTPAASAGADHQRLVFEAIGAYLEKNPDVAAKVGTVFQFKLKAPTVAVDARPSSSTKVARGETAGPSAPSSSGRGLHGHDRGQGQPDEALHFGGKLKISGNVMASQKLDFLTKIDRKAMEPRRRGSARSSRARPGGCGRCGARRARQADLG